MSVFTISKIIGIALLDLQTSRLKFGLLFLKKRQTVLIGNGYLTLFKFFTEY